MPQKVDLYDYCRFHKSIPHRSYYPIISNVVISSSGLATWMTDIPSTSQAGFGIVPYLGFLTPYDATLVTSHSVQLNPISAGVLYYVRVQSIYLESLTISDLYTFIASGVATSFFLQEDGLSHILMEDGVSKLGLEA